MSSRFLGNVFSFSVMEVFWNRVCFITARKRSCGKWCFYRCLRFCSRGGCLVRVGACSRGSGPRGSCSWGGGAWSQGAPAPGGVPGPRGHLLLGGVWSRGVPAPGRAGSTHPTGMHSCLVWFHIFWQVLLECFLLIPLTWLCSFFWIYESLNVTKS